MTEQEMRNWSAVDELRLLRSRLLNASTPYCTHQKEVVFWDSAKTICDRSIKKMVKIEALKQVSWTPIEDAGEWDGEMEVHVVSIDAGMPPTLWAHMEYLSDVRDMSTSNLRKYSKFYVYPAPPEFRPENYEVAK